MLKGMFSDDVEKINEFSQDLNSLKIAFDSAIDIQTALDANKLGKQF